MKCPKCKHDNPLEAMFCMKCGTKLERKCPNCGAEYPLEAMFCMKCGAKIADTPPEEPPKLEDMQRQMQERIPQSLADRLFAGAKQMQGEYRLVTALFADVSGSSRMARDMPLEKYLDIMDSCFKMMVDTISIRYEGSINRFIGDCVLAFFGAPITHENDAERAILAALDIMDAVKKLDLNISIGINTGNTYFGEMGSDLMYSERSAWGPDVDFAKRLQDASEPGQILIGASTYRVTRRAFDFGDTIQIDVKGMEERQPAYPVIQVKSHPEKLRGIEGLRAQMIGREHEFSEISEAVDGLVANRGNITSVIGEAGIGKSRLTLEMKRYVDGLNRDEASILCLEGRCVSIGQSISYWPFIDILRTYLNLGDDDSEADVSRKLKEAMIDLFPHGWEDVLPFMGRLLSIKFGDEMDNRLSYFTPEQIKHQTVMRLKNAFIAISRRRPLLLILEDLHWADDLSLDLISLLMDELMENPLMLLCVYRPEREHKCWKIGDIASRKCLDRYREMTLKQLSTSQSRQLVESLLSIDNLPEDTKDMILHKSEGNPFFIEEVIRSLIDSGSIYPDGERWKLAEELDDIDVPDTIQSVVLSRVDRLESETRYVLQCASVIGRLFRYRLLEHLSEHGRDLDKHLSQLEDKELIFEERTVPEHEYAFKHAITQEATYQGILEQRRKVFHSHIANGIEELYKDRIDEFYEELAHHNRLADNKEKALEYALKSGVKLANQFSNEASLSYLNQVEELLEKSSEQHRKEKALLYEKRGEVLQRIGQWTRALKEYEEALQWSDDRYTRAEIYRKMGWLECEEMQDKISARKHLQLGLDELPDDDESVQRVRLEHDMVWATSTGVSSSGERIARCQNAARIAEKMGYRQEQAILYAYIDTMPSALGNYSDEYALRATAIAEELGDLPQMAWVYFVLGHTRIHWRKTKGKEWSEDDLLYLVRSIDISERTGNVQTQALAYMLFGKAYDQLGNYEKAIENIDRGMALVEKTNSLFPMTNYREIMVIYAKQNMEDMVRSAFLRIMKGFASLDIDEESQLRALFSLTYIGPEVVYDKLHDCYNIMGKDAEFPHVAQEILKELAEDVKSRPQKIWYYVQLTELCVELGDMDDARIYAQKAVSIVEEMGRNDYTAFSYPAYLMLGKIDTAGDTAINYLINEANIYSIYGMIYVTWKDIIRIYEKYGQGDALAVLAERVREHFGDSLKELGLSHLLLEEVKLDNDIPVELMEEFSQDCLPVGWEWIEPKGDCGYRLLNPGIEVNVPPGHPSDDAPRFLMESSGDFILETCLQSGNQGKRYGGLLVWKDKGNHISIVVLSGIYYFSNTVHIGATVDGNPIRAGIHNYVEDKAWLRLERKDNRFTGYISRDGENWYCCGYIDAQMDDPIHVGLISNCYNPPPTSTRFEYFKIYRPK